MRTFTLAVQAPVGLIIVPYSRQHGTDGDRIDRDADSTIHPQLLNNAIGQGRPSAAPLFSQFTMQGSIFLRKFVSRIEMNEGGCLLMRFADPHGRRQL
ncbi:hypothetical protein P3T22_000282 [Paraburkholderia sp. GAS348]